MKESKCRVPDTESTSRPAILGVLTASLWKRDNKKKSAQRAEEVTVVILVYVESSYLCVVECSLASQATNKMVCACRCINRAMNRRKIWRSFFALSCLKPQSVLRTLGSVVHIWVGNHTKTNPQVQPIKPSRTISMIKPARTAGHPKRSESPSHVLW